MALPSSGDSKLWHYQQTTTKQSKVSEPSSGKAKQQQDQAGALLEMKAPAAEATTAKHQHSNAQ